MKKRLRKKKHLGEFAQYGFGVKGEVVAALDEAGSFAWLDTFLDFVETHGLSVGGPSVGTGDAQRTFEFYVTRVERLRTGRWVHRTCTEAHRDLFFEHLPQSLNIRRVDVGQLTDDFKWSDEEEA